jgi:hypothetical protein|uniref:Uncharacterized protein n=1 Tax=Fagus sylvatica TaxID=28930 RepID=A0A7L7TAX4_FAGSY|nr:hypothetical protein [Fagus sylvatica]QOC70520.1 hypothetical protein [Fagus sylvatica]QVG61315.1 hypothetical protein [Fagus sylvatica]QVG61371.1 hypothetical protein [Fagus sylvatica]
MPVNILRPYYTFFTMVICHKLSPLLLIMVSVLWKLILIPLLFSWNLHLGIYLFEVSRQDLLMSFMDSAPMPLEGSVAPSSPGSSADQAGPSNAGLAHSPAGSFPSVPSGLSPIPDSIPSVPSLPSLDSNDGEQSVNQREARPALPANPVASRGEEAGPSNPAPPSPLGTDSVDRDERALEGPGNAAPALVPQREREELARSIHRAIREQVREHCERKPWNRGLSSRFPEQDQVYVLGANNLMSDLEISSDMGTETLRSWDEAVQDPNLLKSLIKEHFPD